MKETIVMGAFTFVGYHLVQKLLSEGMNVLALDVNDSMCLSEIEEEKLLLIGRHAGFTYDSLQKRKFEDDIQGIDTVYICLCEPNQASFQESETMQLLERVIFACKEVNTKLVLLSSVHASTVRFYEVTGVAPKNTCENGSFFYKLEQMIAELHRYAILQVPIVYGPWQPTFMMYHQLILDHSTNTNVKSMEEQGGSIVYVEDVAESLYYFGEQQELTGCYYMQSKEEREWKQGFELLRRTKNMDILEKGSVKRATQPFVYNPKYSLQEGLERQILHVKKYKSLYEKMC
ncbi:NAD-dependent epimerase/dehydratase family protein [Microbacteriaceae bacterium 4G12]